jgi:hypothetical protein
MANTTFTGPVTSLNGFIGGPNANAGDTQQGGTGTYAATNASTLTISTGSNSGNTLSAVGNTGVLVFTNNGISSAAGYCFSDGTTWKQVNAPASDISST